MMGPMVVKRNIPLVFSGWLVASWVAFVVPARSQSLDSRQREGLHEALPAMYLIQNATIHVAPSQILESASLLIRRDKIVAVGTELSAPDGTIVIDATGRHIYPGFFDAYLPYGEVLPMAAGPVYWNERIRPESSIAQHYKSSGIRANDLRRAGITTALVAPTDGILRGQSSVVHVGELTADRALVRRDVGQHAVLSVTRRFAPEATTPATTGSRYPSSPMGGYALARQAFYDARWHRDAWRVAQQNPQLDRPEHNMALEALYPVMDRQVPLIVQASNELFVLRAQRFAQEFGLHVMVVGSGMEYRLLDDIVQTGIPLILPVDFPTPPAVAEATAALEVTLESLMHWDHAPENPARLHGAGAKFAFTTLGLTRPADFLARVRKAVERGLPADAALAALTTHPAEFFQVADQLGTLEPGKFASLLISDKPIFEKDAKLVESWTAGQRLELEPARARSFAGLWQIESREPGALRFEMIVRGEERLSGSVRIPAEEGVEARETRIQAYTVRDVQISASFDSELLGHSGKSVLSLIIDQAEAGSGHLVLPSGEVITVVGTRSGDAPAEERRPGRPDRGGRGEQAADTENVEGTAPQPGAQDQEKEPGPALFPAMYPLGDFGRTALPPEPDSVLIHNVTVWTCGPQGVIPGGAILFGKGKIQRVLGAGEALPAADFVIDGQGGHVTPGMIDCHSHMASDSGINEGAQAISAEVRIGDFIDPRDVNIYRQLAGGLTSSNILHGSANPIGGQNQVIKLRWGGNEEHLKFQEAPPGIKFALGENVKQSNRREPSTRYPQTRMGVEQLMHDAFRAAQEYRAAQERHRATGTGLPVRVDLELEALAEIVEGTRWIHCHSYRADEILALIRVLDEFDITIGTFQHILEGYKVAPEMARHGAMASAFSDWWAYKFEVYDAIPYAGALMHEAGIIVSFNSDDAELARHMNHEAAKAVRFGGVSEEDALKFVTLNPAKQLRIDQWVGSLEPGKHADLVLWNGHPLSTMSRCEQTWIDGRKYFDRSEEEVLFAERAQQRAALIQRALDSGEAPARPGEQRVDSSLLWPRFDEFCGSHQHSNDCWHQQVESTCEACHQCTEDDWLCLFGYCRGARHDYGMCGQAAVGGDSGR